ncbi:hypothetical protein SAMN06295888_1624 [Desulfonatronum zhilinae]|nr:hypothetical protein SAMN06295888_1624 [Desulfonatronum zhilinae]
MACLLKMNFVFATLLKIAFLDSADQAQSWCLG